MWYGCDPLREKYPFTSSYVYCDGNPITYVDPDGRIKISWTVTLSVGAQFGFDLADFVSATVNIASVDLVNLNVTIDTDTPDWVSYSLDFVGVDGLHIENEISASAGIPFLGDVEAAAKNSFTDYLNGQIIQNESETGFSLDADVTKVSVGTKCIIGAEAEFNVDFIEGNTFISVWNNIKELYDNLFNSESE